jgi:hypothetical protein
MGAGIGFAVLGLIALVVGLVYHRRPGTAAAAFDRMYDRIEARSGRPIRRRSLSDRRALRSRGLLLIVVGATGLALAAITLTARP